VIKWVKFMCTGAVHPAPEPKREQEIDTNLHGTDEELELYAMHRRAGADVQILEEHLLICEYCRNRLDRTAVFVLHMRQAFAEDIPQPAANPSMPKKNCVQEP
jgi:hypothetical protein